MCVCVCVCGGVEGGMGAGGVCLPPVANSKFFTYIIAKLFQDAFLTVNIVLITACDLFQLCPCFSGPC